MLIKVNIKMNAIIIMKIKTKCKILLINKQFMGKQ